MQGKEIYKPKVYDYIKSRPGEIVSAREIAAFCGITTLQAKRAGYQLDRETGTNVEAIGNLSWRYTAPLESRKVTYTIIEEKSNGIMIVKDQYGGEYQIKPL